MRTQRVISAPFVLLQLLPIFQIFPAAASNDVTLCDGSQYSKAAVVHILQAEKQESLSLQRCKEQKLEFTLLKESSLSFTVTPCTSKIAWSIEYHNHSAYHHVYKNTTCHSDTFLSQQATRGHYTLRVTSLEHDARVHVYTTVREGGPPWLHVRPASVTIKRKGGGKHTGLTVRWNVSNYNPYASRYWLVVNSERSYPTLCQAQDDRVAETLHEVSNTPAPAAQKRKDSRNKASRSGRGSDTSNSAISPRLLVLDLGNRTKYDMPYPPIPGRRYYFDVFAHDAVHDVTFRYGGVEHRFDRVRPQALRDAKAVSIKPKDLDGPLVYRYKVPRSAQPGTHLSLYVTSCGGSTRLRVQNPSKGQTPKSEHQTIVESHRVVKLHGVKPGQRYLIRLKPDKRVSRIEIWATSLGRQSPMPELPEIQEIRDFPELRTCNNVTVRWLPSPDLRPCTYCVLISEMPKTNSDWSPIPNQCQLNVNLMRRTKFAAKYCSTETNRNTAMIRSIPHLEHGKLFTVQVTAQIGNGRVLAYQLLNVRTASKCNHDNSKWT